MNYKELKDKLLENNDFAKEYAVQLLNDYVTAYRLMKRTYEDIKCIELTAPNQLQMRNIIKLCELVEIPYERVDWEDGNRVTKTQYDEVSFIYNGIKFFELVEKENNNG